MEYIKSLSEYLSLSQIIEEDYENMNQIPNSSRRQNMYDNLSNNGIQNAESKYHNESNYKSNRENNSSKRQFSPSSKSSKSNQTKRKKFTNANENHEKDAQQTIKNTEDGSTINIII